MNMPGVTIGPYAIVAGGAVVTENVLECVIIGGNSAKEIGKVLELAVRRSKETPPFLNDRRSSLEE